MNDTIDFKLLLDVNRDIRILQITDTQPIDYSQQRFNGRLQDMPYGSLFTEKMKYDIEFSYLEKEIKDSNPDLILVTGDIVYGEFDDNGSNLKEFVSFMDSFKIPWAPVFGNHDNECKLGVTWQCAQFENAKYCMFKRNNVTGNGNYNIGIYNHNKLIRIIYMMDSNGTYNGKTYSYIENYPPYNQNERITKIAGIYDDQLEYIENSIKAIDNQQSIKKTICMHIIPDFIHKYLYLKGYLSNDEANNLELFDLKGDHLIDNKDFGKKGEKVCSFGLGSSKLFELLKKYNFDTMFVGHDHVNTFSIDCDGIRVSYGIKSSAFDFHDVVGSLLFSINENNYKIEHNFIVK